MFENRIAKTCLPQRETKEKESVLSWFEIEVQVVFYHIGPESSKTR